MTVSTLCFHLVFILFVTSQCQSVSPPLTNGNCSAGYYKKKQLCEMCESGYYMDKSNTLGHCFPCRECDVQGNEVEHSNCTPKQNRVCVCKTGYFRNEGFCKPCHQCRNCMECLNCKEKCNQQTTVKTTAVKTTAAGCGNGYFLENGQCHSCVNFKCKKESCNSFCTTLEPPGFSDVLLLVSLIVVALLGGLLCLLLIWFCRRRWLCWQTNTWHVAKHPNAQIQLADQAHDVISIPIATERNAPACNKTTTRTSPATSFPHSAFSGDLQSIMAPLIANGNPKLMQVLQKESWPAPVLYTVIREIPVLRWKEFLRLLSVSDDQMERIELEAGPSYLEKQYMMLRLWSQSSGAKLENIYSTLHYMNLSGCAQELQEKLDQLQSSMKAASS